MNDETPQEAPDRWNPEPRWHALIAVLAVGGIYTALPSRLIIGPRWLFPVVVLVLLIPTVFAHWNNYHRLNRIFGFLVTSFVTLAEIVSVVLLICYLPAHSQTSVELLVSAGALWTANILVFSLWYWRLDAGGPHRRDSRFGHPDGAFLFPQMTLPADDEAKDAGWSPNFIDYLFLSFNTSTAFSPTDVPVLARWAKVLMMLQSLVSLTVLVLLAARAVNIL